MPLELQIIRASEFIRLGAPGHLDLASSREIIQQLACACHRRGIDRALLDLRDVHPGDTPMLSRKELGALINTFCSSGFSDRLRLVLLYSSDPHHRARIFALMSILRGWNVKASENFEEALHWLSEEQDVDNPTEPKLQEVPVRKTRRLSAPAPRPSQVRDKACKQTKTSPRAGSHTPWVSSRKVSVKTRQS
jgi:hypothetical protein